MRNRNKLLALHLVVIAAIAFSVASFFAPVASYSSLDYFKSQDIDNPDWYYKMDYYLLFDHLTGVKGDKIFNKYYVLGFAVYRVTSYKGEVLEIGGFNPDLRNYEFSDYSYYIGLFFIFGPALFILFFYFCYKSIKSCGHKKTRFFLYAGVTAMVIAVGSAITTYLFLSFQTGSNEELLSFFRLDYGFYCLFASAFLFFVAFFMQYFFIDFSEGKPRVEKVLFERYRDS